MTGDDGVPPAARRRGYAGPAAVRWEEVDQASV
jgi:hypothetical protein